MNFFKNHRIHIIFIIFLFVMISSVFAWNKIINKDEIFDNNKEIDLNNFDNISIVDAKLGSDYRITQSYFLNYIIKKTGTWYMSSAYVKNINKNNDEVLISLSNSEDSDEYILASIDNNKCDVKKGDLVNFIGTINIGKSSINLSKISKDTINYKNVRIIEVDDLIKNINDLKNTYFIVSGYMATLDDGFRLYDSKDEYKKNTSAINYFSLTWKDEFKYTGNQEVKVKCLLEDSYKLKDCELQ